MLKPRLQIALHHQEYIPDALYTARKIREGFAFIDANKHITLDALPIKWIRFWCVGDNEILRNISEFPITADENTRYKLLVSLVTFGYLYTRYYRMYDFADLQNYFNVYCDFQKLLLILSAMNHAQRSALPRLRAFDLENITGTLDKLNAMELFKIKNRPYF